ncbi:MAG: hypothetical protein K2L17_07265 [Muribaculaceae bacterium]|nr:hypothetical protein [Muribaculaceae bacterium]
MKLKRIHMQRFFSLLAVLVLTGAFTACINDTDDCPKNVEGSDYITLSFQLTSSEGTRSRAENGHDESESEWPAFEDIIEDDDFAFFIFTRDSEGNWPMIMSMTDLKTATDKANMTVSGVSGVWIVTAAIPKADLEGIIGYEIKSGMSQNVPLRVAVIANAGGAATSATNKVDYSAYVAEDFVRFIDKANTLKFAMTKVHSGSNGDSSVDGIYKGAIPMYGMKEFSISGDMLYYANEADPAWLGEVDILRALAKLRVIDNIENKNPTTHLPRIDEVSIDSRTIEAYVLPTDAENFSGVQKDISRPVPVIGEDNFYTLKLGFLNENSYRNDSTRIGYLPEQLNVENNCPIVKITVTFETDASGNPTKQQTYDVPLAGYNGVNFTANLGNSIIRNHIYTLSIDGVSLGADPDVHAEVMDWEPSEFELDYTNNVNVSSKLDWQSGFASRNLTTGEIVMLPWTSSVDGDVAVPLRATFGINTPVGATWTAYLIAVGENANDTAFEFIVKDEDNNDVRQSFATGVIDGKNAMTIRIVSTDPNPSQVNRALLQVVVTVGEGTNSTVSEADLTPEGAAYHNFIIIQDIN